jgi:hypothetical protein
VRKLLIALMLASVVLVGVCLPAAAQTSHDLSYTPTDVWVYLNGTYAGSSKVVDGALVKGISVATQGWGGKYKLDIQSGTKIRLTPNGGRVYNSALVRVFVSADILCTSSNCLLWGKPVTLYKLVGEDWVKLADIRL